MTKPNLHRAIAATAAAAITLGLFSAIVSIAAEDQARLVAARSVHEIVVAKAPATVNR